MKMRIEHFLIQTVDENHLEVEAKHCKGGIVGKRGSRPKKKTIGQIQPFDFLKIEKFCSIVVVVLLLLMLLLSLLVVFLWWYMLVVVLVMLLVTKLIIDGQQLP